MGSYKENNNKNGKESSNNDSGKKNSGFPSVSDECFNSSGIYSQIHKSFLSRPLDKINIPEIKNLKVEFEYNFYTVDERSVPDIPGEKTLVNLDIDNSDEIFYRVATQKKPRLIKVSFKKPKIYNNSLKLVDIPGKEKGYVLSAIVDDILVEGAMSNEIFTGFELIDTGKEEKIYSMLESAQTIIDSKNANDSLKSGAQKLFETLREKGGLFGADKKLIVDALSGLKAQNLNYFSDRKNQETVVTNENDPLGKQTFSIQLNNLLMHDVIRESCRIPDNVYQDELRGLESLSKSIYDKLIKTIPPTNTYNELDYQLQVPAIEMTPIKSAQEAAQYPSVEFLGYLVEKYELLSNEGVVYLGKFLIEDFDKTFFVDYDVVYGKKYFYKIRTVCRIKTVVSTDNISNSILNQSMLATVYAASEGISDSVLCEENTPPPPPGAISATFDFKTLKPKIRWQFPLNKQRDIVKFQIFKRLDILEPFTLIAEYDFDRSEIKSLPNEIAISKNIYKMLYPRLSFIDKSHNEGEKPIYAVACVDAHSLSSNYSAQVQVERNRYTNKVDRKIISGPNAPKPYPNMLINQDAFLDSIKTSKLKNMKIFFDPEYYQVFKTRVDEQDGKGESIREDNLNFLAIDPDKFTYKLQIINVDNQKDQIIKIKLADRSSPGGSGIEVKQPAENFSRNNISFQYGIN